MTMQTIAKKLTGEQIKLLECMRIGRFKNLNKEGERLLDKLAEHIILSSSNKVDAIFSRTNSIQINDKVTFVEFRPAYRS